MDIVAATRIHSIPEGEVTLLGAYESVTGAMTLIDVKSARVLIDCGVAQGREARGWFFPDEARDLDAVLLTHGHNDHVGSLPELFERGFTGPVYGTAATLEIADIVLRDGIELRGGSEDDVRRFVQRFRQQAKAVPFGVASDVGLGDVRFAFREAGHILGSASVELSSPQSRVIVSGDLGRPGTPLLRDYHSTWSGDRPVDLVVMECTYGDGEHQHTHGDVRRELKRIVERARQSGGHILVPAFAIGRTQTLLYHLDALIEDGEVRGLPVAVDTPMGLEVTEEYEKFSRLFDDAALRRVARGDDPLDFEGLYAVRKGRDSVRLRDVTEPMVIIAGSGMCTGGRIVGHLQELLPRPETTVVFVGYQARGTPGRAIQETPAGGVVRLDGLDVRVEASIETLSGLSAHADRRELLGWLENIPQVERVALHHGEVEAQESFVTWAGSKQS